MKQSKILIVIAAIIAGLFTATLIFQAGMFVGMEKARYSYRWSENYQRHFGGPPRGFFNHWRRRGNFIGGHGAFGPIIKKNKHSLVVNDRDNAEKVIKIDKKTRIIRRREPINFKDLKINNQVAVIGQPDKEGEIQAKFIRVFDEKYIPPPNSKERR